MSIPVVDLSEALVAGAPGSPDAAARIRAAAMTSGFFYVRHHGIDPALVERQFGIASALLALPPARKQAMSLHHSKSLRGFEVAGAQTLDANARPDVKESYQCGMAYPADHPYVLAGYQSYGHDQWPPELPLVPAQCEEYIQAMLALARRLMQLVALSLQLPETWFDATSDSPMVTLRMIRYPAHPADADERTFGAGAHTDWGALTILAQDRHGGLEIRMPDGQWVPATPIDGTFVVNLGDMVPRWTNGLYRSNPHRVRNLHSGGAPRYSIPFFYEPDYLARIEAVPGTVPEGESPRYAPCTAGEHLTEMYTRTYRLRAAPAEAAP
jgi:isopenicillin N synthase-like dioxygenase